jgi:hypothetical protein
MKGVNLVVVEGAWTALEQGQPIERDEKMKLSSCNSWLYSKLAQGRPGFPTDFQSGIQANFTNATPTRL